MEQPLISVIIPTFNRSGLLIDTLRSILEQTNKDWECIIVDDGSKEKELNSIKEYIKNEKRICLYLRPAENPKGPSACRNYGLKLAKGDYIQFFDDDDIMYPQMLERKVSMIQQSGSDVVVSPLQFYNVEQKKKIKVNEIFASNLVESYVSEKISWYVSGPLWKKSFLSEKFDENIQSLDDWDFNLRNIYRKPYITFLQQPLQYYNMYGLGQTLSTKGQLGDKKQMHSLYITYRKHFLILKNSDLLTPVLHGILIKKLVFLLRFFLVKNDPVKEEIYFLIKKELGKLGVVNKYRVIGGYFSYKYLGTGYRFFKIK